MCCIFSWRLSAVAAYGLVKEKELPDARLTQAQLAKLVGTTASVICRLEDADYQGHSLAMLRRVALALNRRVKIRFAPLRKTA